MTEPIRKLIVTALSSEARPFVDHFGLSKDPSVPFPLFRGDDMVLAVSGVGKVKSAVGVGYLASLFETDDVRLVLNVGIAGATESMNAKIGNLYLVNKIVDRGSGREFFPDMLVNTGIEETSVTTYDKAVTSNCGNDAVQGLVDMEGSGFYEAAAAFFPPHTIACLKIVSDFLEPNGLTAESVAKMVLGQVSAVDSFIKAFESIVARVPNAIGSGERDWMERVSKELHLTATQRSFLKDWVRSYRGVCDGQLPDVLSRWPEAPSDKQEGKQRLEEIRKELLTK